uniref:Putative secreted protein n=1 Tax=Ixodes ricinus TaxID=34613 RepID=A0A6B0VA70_IXORI
MRLGHAHAVVGLALVGALVLEAHRTDLQRLAVVGVGEARRGCARAPLAPRDLRQGRAPEDAVELELLALEGNQVGRRQVLLDGGVLCLSGTRHGLNPQLDLVADLVLPPEHGGGAARVHRIRQGIPPLHPGEMQVPFGVGRDAGGVDVPQGPAAVLDEPEDVRSGVARRGVAVQREWVSFHHVHLLGALLRKGVQLRLAEEDRVGHGGAVEVGGEALVEALVHVVRLGEDEGAPARLLRDALVVRHVVELVVVLGPLVLRLGVPLGLALQQERFVQLVLGHRHLVELFMLGLLDHSRRRRHHRSGGTDQRQKPGQTRCRHPGKAEHFSVPESDRLYLSALPRSRSKHTQDDDSA